MGEGSPSRNRSWAIQRLQSHPEAYWKPGQLTEQWHYLGTRRCAHNYCPHCCILGQPKLLDGFQPGAECVAMVQLGGGQGVSEGATGAQDAVVQRPLWPQPPPALSAGTVAPRETPDCAPILSGVVPFQRTTPSSPLRQREQSFALPPPKSPQVPCVFLCAPVLPPSPPSAQATEPAPFGLPL